MTLDWRSQTDGNPTKDDVQRVIDNDDYLRNRTVTSDQKQLIRKHWKNAFWHGYAGSECPLPKRPAYVQTAINDGRAAGERYMQRCLNASAVSLGMDPVYAKYTAGESRPKPPAPDVDRHPQHGGLKTVGEVIVGVAALGFLIGLLALVAITFVHSFLYIGGLING